MVCALILATVLCALAAAPRADAYVYWTQFHSIGRASLDGSVSNPQFIVPATTAADVFGVAVNSSKVYWTNGGNNFLGGANLDGGGASAAIILGLNSPWGMAANEEFVYFGNIGTSSVGRYGIISQELNKTFIGGATFPAAVAVNATHIFWSDRDANTIGRANLDGTGADNSFITGVSGPYGVAVNGTHIYWANSGSDAIGRANLDGTGVDTSFITGADDPAGLAINGTHIYWANANFNESCAPCHIGRANLDGTGASQTFMDVALHPIAVQVDAGVSVAPVVTTDGASSVTSTGASLNATINAGGEATTYKYEYGPTTAFGTVVPANTSLSAGAGFTAVAQPPQAIAGLTPATTYFYRACAKNLVTGPDVANQVCGTPQSFTTAGGPTAPFATTSAASAVGNTGAQLNGALNAHGGQTAYIFEYGTTTAFGQIAPGAAQNAGSGTAQQNVNASLSGLAPHTTYLYRLVATNAQGTALGPVMSFTTSGAASAPSVTTAAASNLTAGGARLNGTLNANAQQTVFTFEYGTTTSFGHITAVDNAGSYAGSQQVSLPATGLAADTTYLYRLAATNATGTTSGPVVSFKTPPVSPIYWTDTTADSIGIASRDDGSQVNETFITGANNPTGVTADASHIYWGNFDGGQIGRANLNGTSVTHNFITGGANSILPAINASHIYWANFATNRLARANLDGTSPNHSFLTTGNGVRQVVLTATHVYWANQSDGTIGRAALDGTGVDNSFITGLDFVYGLAIQGGQIYWTHANAGSRRLGRANLDGTGVNASLITGLTSTPQGMAVDTSHIFWAEGSNGKIGRANIDGSGVNESFVTGLGNVTSVGIATAG
jgi:hypothetical protein